MAAILDKVAILAILAIVAGCNSGATDSTRPATNDGGESTESTARVPVCESSSVSDPEDASKELPVDDPFYAHSYPRVSQSTAPHAENVAVEVKRLPLAQEPTNQQIARFVEHLASKGFRLRYDEEWREWRTTEPIVGEHVIRFNIGAFPADSTLREMQLSLFAVNLAFGLNPDAHLAMSAPGLVRLTPSVSDRRDLQDALGSEKFLNARDTLKREFLEYRLSSEK